jgi:hypothetical protein
MKRSWHGTALLVALTVPPAFSGEIPGLPPQLPPYHERDFELAFSNDFLGRGGSVDDFRTQQIIASARLSDKWLAVFDHSILTLGNVAEPARVDQLSASLGYRIVDRDRGDRNDSIVAGVGLRSAGSYAGDRIQNGFHRLIDSTIKDFPYSGPHATDATAWVDANHYRVLRAAGDGGPLDGWRRGVWLRAGSLVTTAGQWDSTAMAVGVASRLSIDLWAGVRGDWRYGYDDIVLQETADAEDDISIVLGARFGALVLETVQQLNNDASYGQLRLVSTGRRNTARPDGGQRLGFEFGFSLPDVHMRVAAKYPSRILVSGSSRWRESVLVAASYGEPQFEDENSLFVRTRQLEIGVEFERPWRGQHDWLRTYVASAGGWRQQSMIAVGELQERRSRSVDRAVLTLGAGVRIDAAGPAKGWQLAIQTGVLGTFPVSDAELVLDGNVYGVQKTSVNVVVGFVLDFV